MTNNYVDGIAVVPCVLKLLWQKNLVLNQLVANTSYS